jgi:hypothetical protein
MEMKTTRKSATGGTLTAAVTPAQPKPELTQAQQLIADEVSALFYGGREKDLAALIDVALSSAAWRQLKKSDYMSDQQKQAMVSQLVSRDLPEYRAALLADWRRAKDAPEAARPAPQDVTERIAAAMTKELRRQFAVFLDTAGPLDQLFMRSVMITWENNSHGRTSLRCSCDLAQAFSREMDGENAYLQIPESFEEAVEEYVRCLRRASKPAA